MDATFYEPRFKDGKIVAFADVDVADGVIVKGFRVVRGERGLFVSVPQKSFTVEGQTRYAHQVVFSTPDLRVRFLSKVLDAYQKWENGKNGSSIPTPSHPPADELVE